MSSSGGFPVFVPFVPAPPRRRPAPSFDPAEYTPAPPAPRLQDDMYRRSGPSNPPPPPLHSQPANNKVAMPYRLQIPTSLQPGMNVAYQPKFQSSTVYRDMVFHLSVDDLPAKPVRTSPAVPPAVPAAPPRNYEPRTTRLPSPLVPGPPPFLDIPKYAPTAPKALASPPVAPTQPPVMSRIPSRSPSIKPVLAVQPVQPNITPEIVDSPITAKSPITQEKFYSYAEDWEEEDRRLGPVAVVLGALRRQRDEDEENDELMQRISRLLKTRHSSSIDSYDGGDLSRTGTFHSTQTRMMSVE